MTREQARELELDAIRDFRLVIEAYEAGLWPLPRPLRPEADKVLMNVAFARDMLQSMCPHERQVGEGRPLVWSCADCGRRLEGPRG